MMTSTLLPPDDPYILSPSELPVKPEPPPSPALVSSSTVRPSLQANLHDQFPPPSSSRTLPNPNPRQNIPHQSIFGFNGVGTINPTISPSPYWTPPSVHHHQDPPSPNDITLQHAISFNDDYDETSEVPDGMVGLGPANSTGGERTVRRRSSKACDQCRKSKCKCERSSPNEPCRNCVMLGTPCTFLGPSRKRGPPKGYIDAIEARLHQAEALLGIILASGDSRAETLLNDIAQDALAREIINRVDSSPYGVKGRRAGVDDRPSGSKSRFTDSASMDEKVRDELISMHPSHEWQDRVTDMLRKVGSSTARGRSPPFSPDPKRSRISFHPSGQRAASAEFERDLSAGRRQKVGMNDLPGESGSISASAPVTAVSTPILPPSFNRSIASSSVSRASSPQFHHRITLATGKRPSSRTSESLLHAKGSIASFSSDGYSSASDEEDFVDAMGQLSLNEEEQVRYHGKASGLHILGGKERLDRRNEGGIWRFPKAGVWPPLPAEPSKMLEEEDELAAKLPSQEIQEQLLNAYFKHVHPFLPIIHKQAFYQAFRSESSSFSRDSPAQGSTPDSDRASVTTSSSYKSRLRRVPPLLLFAMFAVAARHSECPWNVPRPSTSDTMWAAGDAYLEHAQSILGRTYARSRPSTCQALLLMGYREVGIGATASAWTYIGMAIRMAQDLGMHRRADGWTREELGGRIFDPVELQERRRIWFACVIMDKYVSAYIGRPVMIFEKDFDTSLPDEDPEDQELGNSSRGSISCFKATATLSGILSMVIQVIYAVRPVSSRHGELVFIEGMLNKWYYGLPVHLQHDPQSLKFSTPPPCVLTMHMQYWCAILLLHRPFIGRERSKFGNMSEELKMRFISEKSYEICASAANHITSIASLYLEKYTLQNCPAFLSYFVFSAGLMHVISISSFPDDPQASIGLNKCINILSAMQVTWPSATRSLELLKGCKVNFDVPIASPPQAKKRRLESSTSHAPSEILHDSPRSLPSFDNPNSPVRMNSLEAPMQHQLYGSYSSSPNPSLASVNSPAVPYFTPPALQRSWSDSTHYDSVPSFSNDFSAPVLPPQTYNMGLMENRHPPLNMAYGHRAHMNHHHGIHHSSSTTTGSSTHRGGHHPTQYWNDYNFGPFENYDVHSIPAPSGLNTHAAHPPSMFPLTESEQTDNHHPYGKSTLPNLTRHVDVNF
ncbi:hypothetical protein GYMLUDRAFT_50070 [Collybiopsis luxurians FD-317 M1]|uniref:Zn(2)-C6 fungal-type domain-containing protein n=1 Tax=Collybiopsis luxurians FD-317 M1 TaxID=944289 RepID=A0A0D0CB99_9AGAR|nr:hypothetical protein GYMLUDRAFT_50070 [Collybiopsis luxurians FD-317 M1]